MKTLFSLPPRLEPRASSLEPRALPGQAQARHGHGRGLCFCAFVPLCFRASVLVSSHASVDRYVPPFNTGRNDRRIAMGSTTELGWHWRCDDLVSEKRRRGDMAEFPWRFTVTIGFRWLICRCSQREGGLYCLLVDVSPHAVELCASGLWN